MVAVLSSKSWDKYLAFWVILGTIAGGTLAALVAFVLDQIGLSFGFFFGSLTSSINFLVLNTLTKRVLKAGGEKGWKLFWVWNVIRWLGFALVCWLLLYISGRCLLGGLVGYFWFLIVLTWTSLRMASLKKRYENIGV